MTRTHVSSYEGSLLGMGAYGTAFRIRYEGRDAVVKMARSRKYAPLFWEEVQILVDLKGLGGAPRLLTKCCDYPGFVMEFCAGKTLTAMIKDAAPVGTLLRGIHDLALKVQEIHQAGYAHNDLKPDNVILETSGDGAVRARVIDLGLCTRLGVSPGF